MLTKMSDTTPINSSESTNADTAAAATITRQSESPARTIDSHDSTTGSLDTIVDRTLNRGEMLHTAIEHSINTTNAQQQHNSLTNSQISMLQQHSSDEEHSQPVNQMQHQQLQQQQQQQHQQQQRQQIDAQHHIYSSPVYDQKPPLKLSAATILATVADSKATDDTKKPKLITHEEFQQQLQEAVASRANTLDSRISKKQRFPPELIKIKDGDGGSSLRSHKTSKVKSRHGCCAAFPVQIVLGSMQLVLAVSLVALGSLLIVRDAALGTAGCGIWTGLIAAVTGSLGVVSIRKTQTAFLAFSLICIASSTLALAISGAALSRDINRMEEKFDLMNANSEISAACGLIFALFLHFVVSIVSVYRCAINICSRSEHSELKNVVIKSNSTLDQHKMEQYIKTMSHSGGSEKENNEKLAAMWMCAAQMGSLPPPSVRKLSPPRRPIMLIPATAGSNGMLTSGGPLPPPSAGMFLSSPLLPPGMPYRGMRMPAYLHPVSPYGPPPPISMPGTFRTHKSAKSVNSQRRQKRNAQLPRSGKMDANRRQRRKSETDIVDGRAFQYTGLDRAIADSFLAHQEQHSGSHIDYSSSSSSAASPKHGQPAKRTPSKTKIVCRDVVM